MKKEKSDKISVIILGAGKGTRMKSNLPKVMHRVAGMEMLNIVIETAKKLSPKDIVIVISQEMEMFIDEIIKQNRDIKISFAIQKERKGTAHAVSIGLEKLEKLGNKVLILYADTPLISEDTLKKIITKLDKSSLCVLAFEDKNENQYGRIVVDGKENISEIIEFKDANSKQRKISLCNSGVMAIDGSIIKKLISKIENKNASKEFYLTDIVSIARKQNLECGLIVTEISEVIGVNSRKELAEVEKIKQNKIRKELMENGVTLIDPSTNYFSCDIKISNDVIIHPNVVIGKGVTIESGVEIKSFCHIEGAHISSGCVIGPFARIRPKTKIESNVRIGNFVEIKESKVGNSSKINHLSYIGDVEIGTNSNIGAGTISCNYDGYKKFKTKIGDNVFVGSNASLISPLNIENNSIIGAGSVITKDVKKNEIAIARSNQTNIENGAKIFHEKRSKKK